MSIKIGISTACYYPTYLEDAIKSLCDNNIKNIEIFINSNFELEPDFAKQIKSELDKSNTKVVSVHPYISALDSLLFFTPYERRFNDGLEALKKHYDFINSLGANIFVFHGDLLTNPSLSTDEQYERIYRLNKDAKEQGIIFAHENVARCKGGDLKYLSDLAKIMGDDIHFALDTKQAIRKGLDPYDFLEKLNKNICHIHISDYNDESDCMLIGKGSLDFKRFINTLKSFDFDGAIILELYKRGYKTYEDLFENYKFMENICK